MTSPPPAHPGVRFPPPLLFVVAFLVGWLTHRTHPLPLFAAAARPVVVLLGWLCIVLWGGLSGWALATFHRARTAIIPNRPATRLVMHGPYRLSRNPMYLALTLLYVGVALLLNSVWPLMLLPLILVILHVAVIRREERYLAAAFGAAYDGYRRWVRRWL